MKILHRFLLGAIATGLILSVADRSQAAGRFVLNQSPQTIERYFGRYWTRLTRTENGITRVTYTYSPAGLQRVFPNTQIDRFAIAFVDNRSQQISINITGDPDPDSFTYDRPEASRLYEYIFGYRPSIWQLLNSRFTGNETIYDYEYCLGDGVATAFTLGGAAQFVWGDVTLYYDSRCEPPYMRR
ncbi:MAG: hypothetical protein F6K28_38715 [Microcoleus sp. SIO2G3]|nr:hypothetical protein [Microcoleus sp. SIO2G3]